MWILDQFSLQLQLDHKDYDIGRRVRDMNVWMNAMIICMLKTQINLYIITRQTCTLHYWRQNVSMLV